MFRTSFKRRAKIIDAGKTKIIPNKLKMMVFQKTFQNMGLVRKFWKCVNPTHGLAANPKNGLKSLKTIARPHIGAYLNKT